MSEDRPLSLFNRVRACFMALGATAAGAFILWAPDEARESMRAEMSDTVLVLCGSWFLACGVVVGVTAIFASSANPRSLALASRLRGLVLVLLAAAVLGMLLPTAGLGLWGVWQLHQHGQPADAVVVDVQRRLDGKGRLHIRHTIRYDGHRAQLELPGSPQRGDSLAVLYLPQHPATVAPGRPGDALLDLVDRTWGIGASLGYLAAMAVLVACILFGFHRFFVGRRVRATASES